MIDTDEARRLVQKLSAESEAYTRQFQIWLGAASGGGITVVMSLVYSLPNKAYTLDFFFMSLLWFIVGLISAGISTLTLAQCASAKAQHFASAHNRDSLNEAISKIPEVFTYPRSKDDRQNARRNELIIQSQEQHAIAERAWKYHRMWRLFSVSLSVLSGTSFLIGLGIPLIYIGFLGVPLTP